MSDKLKPCPFCGGEAMIRDLLANRYHIQCQSCAASFGEIWGCDEAIEDLTNGWNKRIKSGR